jgi:hypothetical protein
MNTREMWENQVELLTRHCRALSEQVDKLEQRVTYYENVLFTLLTALKDGGVIVDSDESDSKHYEF